MSYNKGASMAQYAIIVALVGVALCGTFLTLGKTISEQLASMHLIFADNNVVLQNNAIEEAIREVSLVAGSLEGTLKTPVRDCVDGTCALDYGEFTLNGIPDNFGTFVETSGTAGGTDLLSSLIDQVADYLEESGETEASAEYRQLANLGHLMADFNEAIEKAAETCSLDFGISHTKGMSCFRKEINTSRNAIQVPENLQDIISNNTEYDLDRLLEQGVLIGEAKNEYLDMCPEGVCSGSYESDISRYPSYAMVSVFEKIVSNPNYSEDLKNITKELYRNISDLAYDQAGHSQSAMHMFNPYRMTEYDPVTGEEIGEKTFLSSDNFEEILNPQASTVSDIDSALICTTSGNVDSNGNCHSNNGNNNRNNGNGDGNNGNGDGSNGNNNNSGGNGGNGGNGG